MRRILSTVAIIQRIHRIDHRSFFMFCLWLASTMASTALTDLLRNQFQCAQDYCNAQTALRNALLRSSGSSIESTTSDYDDDDGSPSSVRSVVVQATMAYQTALYELQDLLKALDEEYQDILSNNLMNRQFIGLLGEHLQRTQRIIASIISSSPPVMHPSGVMQSQSVSVDDMTLALSTLRASLRTVLNAVP